MKGVYKGIYSRTGFYNIGALITRIGFLYRVLLKGSARGSIVGFYNIGALIIRIGFLYRVLLKGSTRGIYSKVL